MPVTIDALKELAIDAMKAAYGDSVGTAYGFLMFGGYGVPGIADGATLAAKADSVAAADLTQGLAVSLVADSAKVGLAAFLKTTSLGALEGAGITAETLASASVLVVSGIFDSTEIAPDPPDPVVPVEPVGPGPADPKPVIPDPIDPDPIDPDPIDPDPADPDPIDPDPIDPDPADPDAAKPIR